MNVYERGRFIALARQHAIEEGYAIADAEVVDIVEHPDCLVIHFDNERTDPTGKFIIFDTPSSVAVFVDRNPECCYIPNVYRPNPR